MPELRTREKEGVEGGKRKRRDEVAVEDPDKSCAALISLKRKARSREMI